MIADGSCSGVQLDPKNGLQVQTVHFGQFSRMVPRLAASAGIRLFEVAPADESLGSVFAYLIES
ncbi:hypothetical protein [Fodinicola feengrottensis]|uniref:hypothetical protein n=1 Tax=Fodinicola feengrottensis TaxID=435914 RepID=UPI002442C6ED|nr:hypothetical protein [Fodinicola feengrottensis]